ncbi:hypothetical protein CAL27_20795 [Bordetella genomosp. 1]|uniref:Major facilitator superfamily (MFS) profile domain-containing protein n=1 Tax=Bordetella genomosp. 1 TaxID=1395607 RepID=A0ABX4EUL8_9BORD|nr:hypothetical protein CAL27_20795 [Bordetella genomosp. 1]
MAGAARGFLRGRRVIHKPFRTAATAQQDPLKEEDVSQPNAASGNSAGNTGGESAYAMAQEARIVDKIIRAIVPLAIIGLFVSYIDRASLAIAGPEMAGPLGLTPAMFGLSAGLFFIGYVLFEVPSNFALRRVGARIWLARIMVTWGLVCLGTAWVGGPTSLYVMRFLLGVAEAGFYPGVLFYISLFLPRKHLARAFSMFQLGIPVSLAIGSIFTSTILYMHGMLGVSGWQWVFIIEGAITMIVGVIWYVVTSRGPADAKFLEPSEKTALIQMLRRDGEQTDEHGIAAFMEVLKSPRAWLFSIIFIFMMLGFYSVIYWLPQIIKHRMGLSNIDAGMMSAIPWVVSAIALFVSSRYVSWSGRRVPALIFVLAFCGVGMLISSQAESAFVALVGLSMGAVIQSAVPLLYAVVSHEFNGTRNAIALAFVNSVGGIGGFIGPYVLGLIRQSTGGDAQGLLVLSLSFFIAALIAVSLLRLERAHHAAGITPA